MTLRLAIPLLEDFAALARDMRPDEVEQFVAMSGVGYDAQVAARGFINAAGPKFVLIDPKGMPVLAGGFLPVAPMVSEAWMLGSLATWDQHWRSITRAARRLIDGHLKHDAHRVQIVSLASRTRAHHWYEKALGMQHEGRLRRFCGDGQDAMMHAKVREVRHG